MTIDTASFLSRVKTRQVRGRAGAFSLEIDALRLGVTGSAVRVAIFELHGAKPNDASKGQWEYQQPEHRSGQARKNRRGTFGVMLIDEVILLLGHIPGGSLKNWSLCTIRRSVLNRPNLITNLFFVFL